MNIDHRGTGIMRKLLIVFICILLSSIISMDLTIKGEEGAEDPSMPIALEVHDPISIDSDLDLIAMAASEGWPGSGAQGNPYIISNISIDGDHKNLGIYIGNTTLYVEIWNSTITNVTQYVSNRGNGGLKLKNVGNISVMNMTANGNHGGIIIEGSSSVIISRSNLSTNLHGISLSGSNDITVMDSIISENENYGLYLVGNDIDIMNCSILSNRDGGILFRTLDGFNISGNEIIGNMDGGGIGEGIRSTNWLVYNGRIDNNTILNNGLSGLNIYTGSGTSFKGFRSYFENNTVGNHSSINIICGKMLVCKDNTVFNSSLGISVWASCEIYDNEVYDCDRGIDLGSSCRASNNIVHETEEYGIRLGGEGSSAVNNVIYNNSGDGIVIAYSGPVVENNIVKMNGLNGILINADSTIIKDNIIAGNGENGTCVSGDHNTFIENVISDNGNCGLFLDSVSHFQMLNDHIYENRGHGISGDSNSLIRIEGVDIHDNGGRGILLNSSDEALLMGVTTSNNELDNIMIRSSGNLTLDDLSTFSSVNGAWIWVDDHLIVRNSSFFALETGINIYEAGHVIMDMNMFQNCGPFFSGPDGPGSFDYNSMDIDDTNLVNGRKLYLVNNSFPFDTIPPDAGQVIIDRRDNIKLIDLDLSDTTMGLLILDSNGTTISGCTFDNDIFGSFIFRGKGISLRSSSFDNCVSAIEINGTTMGEVSNCSFIRCKYTPMTLERGTFFINIHSNLFFGSTHPTAYALRVMGENCTIWDNLIIYNRGTTDENISYRRQVYNEGLNFWYRNRVGNYWRDLHYPDIDNDGLVDSYYPFEGPTILVDPYPLSHCPLFEPPTLDVISSFDGRSILLEWKEPDLEGWSEITGFNIYRRVFPGELIQIASRGPSDRSFTDANAKSGVDYRYSITAVNELVESDLSLEMRGLLDFFLPNLFILEPIDGTVIGDDRIFLEWIGIDNESGIDHFEVRIDLDDWLNVGLSTQYTFFELTEGTHILKVKAIDNAGGEVVEQVTFMVDMGKPTVTILEPGAGSILATNHTTVRWDATDDLSRIDHFEFSVDNGTLFGMDLSRSIELMELYEGVHIVKVIAFDEGGNSDHTTINFTVDSISPSVSIGSPSSGILTPERDLRVTWNGYDIGTGVFNYLFKLDDQEWVDVGLDIYRNLWQLSDGPHEVKVQIRDRAGNLMIDEINFTIDGSAPDLEITYPSDGSYVSSSPVNVQWTVSDGISGVSHVQFLDNTSTWQNVSGLQFPLRGLNEDIHTITLRAFDNVGNKVEKTATFTVDRTPPEILGYGPEGDDVPLDEPIFVSFSERMQKSSLNFIVEGAMGNVIWRGERAFFEPRGELEPGRSYNVSISGTDLAGNGAEPIKWSFTTTVVGKIRGKVVTDDGTSVPNAVIEVGAIEIETRPDGGFVVEMANGTYELKVSKDGFRSQTIEVNVTAGRINDLPDIVLKRSKDNGIDLFKVLMIPIAILLMVVLAFIVGTLLSRKRVYLDEE